MYAVIMHVEQILHVAYSVHSAVILEFVQNSHSSDLNKVLRFSLACLVCRSRIVFSFSCYSFSVKICRNSKTSVIIQLCSHSSRMRLLFKKLTFLPLTASKLPSPSHSSHMHPLENWQTTPPFTSSTC